MFLIDFGLTKTSGFSGASLDDLIFGGTSFGGKTVWMNWSRHSKRKRKHMDIILQLVLTHIKALTWLIFAIYQSIVKFYAESEYDVYFFQKLLDNVQIEHFMIPPLFDKNQRGFSTCVILILFLFFFIYSYNLNFVNVIKPQLFFLLYI